MIRTLTRDDYSLLLQILDAQCQPYTTTTTQSNTVQSAEERKKWIDLNSGIIGEFMYDFQSRFWFTYRRNFDRIGGDTSLLTTDAGWGCMLRTGQSMVAEAMARIILGRGTVGLYI